MMGEKARERQERDLDGALSSVRGGGGGARSSGVETVTVAGNAVVTGDSRRGRSARSGGGGTIDLLRTKKTLVRSVRNLRRRKAEAGIVELGDGKDMDEREDGFREDVEHAVEDHFGIDRDDIAAFAESPRDRVQEPEEREDRGREQVGARETGAEAGGRGTGGDEEHVPDEDEGGAAKGEEALRVATSLKRRSGCRLDRNSLESFERKFRDLPTCSARRRAIQ